MKKLTDFDFKNKTVLLRCDFNVPISQDGEILDDFRIRKAIPTIRYLIKERARIVLMSHLELKKKDLSLTHIIPRLNELLNQKIELLTDYIEEAAKEKIKKIEFGQIILLENLRFYEQEEANNDEFAKKLSQLGDIFINEAFSVSHREHASIVSIVKYLPSTFGILFEKELEILSKILEKPKHPFVVIVGGIKIETKMKTIINLLEKADYLLLGSKMGEAVLAYRENVEINERIQLPLDGIIGSKDQTDKRIREGVMATVKKEEDVFDIGPRTIKLFRKIIKEAKTILLNGPIGVYENKRFEKGTREILNAITNNKSAFKIAGGGDTISAIKKFGLTEKFDFLSTGGGAMLKFLAGEKLPGIEVLKNK
jgi:phosphoglycerate kinase